MGLNLVHVDPASRVRQHLAELDVVKRSCMNHILHSTEPDVIARARRDLIAAHAQERTFFGYHTFDLGELIADSDEDIGEFLARLIVDALAEASAGRKVDRTAATALMTLIGAEVIRGEGLTIDVDETM